MKKTKKALRELLNKQDANRGAESKSWRHNQYYQRTRLYGDYLYNQDKDMFNEVYRRWVEGKDEELNELNSLYEDKS